MDRQLVEFFYASQSLLVPSVAIWANTVSETTGATCGVSEAMQMPELTQAAVTDWHSVTACKRNGFCAPARLSAVQHTTGKGDPYRWQAAGDASGNTALMSTRLERETACTLETVPSDKDTGLQGVSG